MSQKRPHPSEPNARRARPRVSARKAPPIRGDSRSLPHSAAEAVGQAHGLPDDIVHHVRSFLPKEKRKKVQPPRKRTAPSVSVRASESTTEDQGPNLGHDHNTWMRESKWHNAATRQNLRVVIGREELDPGYARRLASHPSHTERILFNGRPTNPIMPLESDRQNPPTHKMKQGVFQNIRSFGSGYDVMLAHRMAAMTGDPLPTRASMGYHDPPRRAGSKMSIRQFK